MLDKLRDRMATFLSAHQICVVSATGSGGASAMPARYRSHRMEIDCILPRWADVVYHLEQDPRVALVILDTDTPGLRWLHCLGTARIIAQPDWDACLPAGVNGSPSDKLYSVVRVTPTRMDLMDETLGWGVRETLETGPIL